jgi:TolB-like protein/DNA-binding winged helix-turn-helix (wHTH) protein
VSSLPGPLQVGEWRVEPELDLITRDGSALKIEPRAMRVLLCLVSRAGHIVSVSELLEEVWPDVVVGPDSVYQAVGLLRRTLGDDRHHPKYIAHVARKGYRLIAPVGPTPAAPPTTTAPTAGLPEPSHDLQAVDPARAPVIESDPPRVDASARMAASPASAVAPSVTPIARAKRLPPGGPAAWTVLAIVALILGAYLFVRSAQRAAPPAAAVVPVATANIPIPPRGAPPNASIAVLPFVDMTEKQDLGYLADGITEELIDLLSRGSDLRVPARTSSFYFKGKPTTVHDIAHALNVDHLLEGSVRRSGKRVRVTAQLIRADNGYHLWSQTYDRELTEIFTVEDDIAQAVTRALQAKLNTDSAETTGVSMNGEARNLLLQCQFFVQRNTGVDAEKAVSCYRELLKLAPRDAAAWAGYADALWRLRSLTQSSAEEDRLSIEASRQAAEHAIALDPTLAAPHAVVAVYHRVIDRDWGAAEAEVKAALTTDPEDPLSLLAASRLAMTFGQLDRAVGYLERARARDPLNFLPYARLGMIYLYQGRLAEAEAAVRRRLDLSPEGHGGYTQLADVLLARGQPQAALDAAQREPNEDSRLLTFALVYYALGRKADADSALAEFKRKFSRAKTGVAEIRAYRGEVDQAFAALEEAFAAGDPELFSIKSDYYLIPLHADPRYQILLKKLKLPERGPV